MDSPTSTSISGKQPVVLSPCRSLRRRSSSASSNSPEFEFWHLTKPLSQPDLLSADELFLDGVLVPLHHLSFKTHQPDPDASIPDPDPPPVPEPEPAAPELGPGSELTRETNVSGMTASKRWRDIFKKFESKSLGKSREIKEKESKRREKKSQTGSGSGLGTELNINIWPFSRSKSAGNSVTRPATSFGAPATRKVSSAPCSRSNSAGESQSRKCPCSPGRVGVHLGRSSSVWHARRGVSVGKPISEPPVWRGSGERGVSGKKENMEGRKGKTVNERNKAKVLIMNVPMCIGHRSRLSCRSDESGSSNCLSADSNVGSGNSNPNTNSIFGLRNLFIKKVH